MEVTDLLGFPPGMLDPGLKIAETRIFETNAADRGGADSGCSRTDPLSRTRTLPRGNVRIEEGKA
jgi:hypothetical protein